LCASSRTRGPALVRGANSPPGAACRHEHELVLIVNPDCGVGPISRWCRSGDLRELWPRPPIRGRRWGPCRCSTAKERGRRQGRAFPTNGATSVPPYELRFLISALRWQPARPRPLPRISDERPDEPRPPTRGGAFLLLRRRAEEIVRAGTPAFALLRRHRTELRRHAPAGSVGTCRRRLVPARVSSGDPTRSFGRGHHALATHGHAAAFLKDEESRRRRCSRSRCRSLG